MRLAMSLSIQDPEPLDAAAEMSPAAKSILERAGTARLFNCSMAFFAIYIYVFMLLIFLAQLRLMWRNNGSDILPGSYSGPWGSFLWQLLGSLIVLAEFLGLALHWHYARSKRFYQHSEVVRAGAPPTDGVGGLRCWFFSGFALAVLCGCFSQNLPDRIYYSPYVYEWSVALIQESCAVLALIVVMAFSLVPSSVPHFATTLLLQVDLENLSLEVSNAIEADTEEAFEHLLEQVARTKVRWANFLRLHFLIEGTAAIAFLLLVISFAELQFYSMRHTMLTIYQARAYIVIFISGPLCAVYVAVQVLSVANFNEHVTNSKNSVPLAKPLSFQFMSQKETSLQIRVLGITITKTKIRASLLSFVIVPLLKILITAIVHL